MTRAVWVTPTYPWRDEPVAGTFFRTQARALVRLHQDITVCAPVPWAPWPLSRMRTRWRHHADAPRLEVADGLTVVRPRYPNLPGEPSWAMPDRFIAWAARRTSGAWPGAELVHGHSIVTGLAAWRLARSIRLPFVLTFHGSDMNAWPDAHPERLPDLRAAAREAAAIVAVSAALAAKVQHVTGVAATHLPIGSDHGALAAAVLPRAAARDRLGIPGHRIVVLFVGNLLVSKGVRELVDAILALGDPFAAILVGGGPESGYRADEAAGRVEYRGPVAHDEVVRYMAAADVLVLPSTSEGLPTVVVEAGSVGLPVIGSKAGGIPELLAPDRGTILGAATAPEIMAALTWFAGHREQADSAARRLREHVRSAYDVDVNGTRLIEIYRAAIADHGASSPRP